MPLSQGLCFLFGNAASVWGQVWFCVVFSGGFAQSSAIFVDTSQSVLRRETKAGMLQSPRYAAFSSSGQRNVPAGHFYQ